MHRMLPRIFWQKSRKSLNEVETEVLIRELLGRGGTRPYPNKHTLRVGTRPYLVHGKPPFRFETHWDDEPARERGLGSAEDSRPYTWWWSVACPQATEATLRRFIGSLHARIAPMDPGAYTTVH